MTIDQMHDNIRDLINPGQGRYFDPPTIDSAINMAVLDRFKEEYTRFEETQEITDTLGFFKSDPTPLSLTSGIATLPSDFVHLTDIEAVINDGSVSPISIVNDASWSLKKDSAGFPPTALYPVGRQSQKKIQVLPLPASGVHGVASIVIYYIRKPLDALYNYTIVDGGYGFAFNATGSRNVEWPDVDHNRIILKAIGYLGLPIQNQTKITSEEIKKRSGA
jgi:hypothetical protein